MNVPQDSFHFVVEPVQVYCPMWVLQFVVVVLLLVALDTIKQITHFFITLVELLQNDQLLTLESAVDGSLSCVDIVESLIGSGSLLTQ